MPRPRMSAVKRQREQAKRDRQQRKAERRDDRKRQDSTDEQMTVAATDGDVVDDPQPVNPE